MQNLDLVLCGCKLYVAGDYLIAARKHMVRWMRLDGLKLIEVCTHYVVEPVGEAVTVNVEGDWHFMYEHNGDCYAVSLTNATCHKGMKLPAGTGSKSVEPADGYVAAFQCGEVLISEDISGRMVVSRNN